jgi:transposase-like protein
MAKNQGPVASAKHSTVSVLPLACTSEDAAVAFFEERLWRGVPRCGHCGGTEVGRIIQKPGKPPRYLWRCRAKACRKQFSVRVGTVLEDSRIPLRFWAYAFWAACASKKGVSAKQIQRQTGLSYKSALFLMHRIRWAMAEDHSECPKLDGTVECDETYVGGVPHIPGTPQETMWKRKTPVIGIVQRDGSARIFPIAKVNARNLRVVLTEHVSPAATIMTDESTVYPTAAAQFSGGHHAVKHSAKEYVRDGWIHTNTVEGVFSLLKRGLYGTFHNVSRKHLGRYCSEFEFRHNARKLSDGERVDLAVAASKGKRLTYREQVYGSTEARP